MPKSMAAVWLIFSSMGHISKNCREALTEVSPWNCFNVFPLTFHQAIGCHGNQQIFVIGNPVLPD